MTAVKKQEADNRRMHLRYRDPEASTVEFSVDQEGITRTYKALIVNESYSGMAVVFVSSQPLKKGDVIQWHETEKIKTDCKVIRCRKVDQDVYVLALEL